MATSKDVEKLLEDLGVSRAALARMLSVAPSTITNYLNGRNIPSVKQDVIERMMRDIGSVNISGDGNVSNIGVGRVVSTGDGDVYALKKRIKELEEEVRQLRKDKAVLQEFVTFLQNNQKS